MSDANQNISKVDEHPDEMCMRFMKYWFERFPRVQIILSITSLIPFQGKCQIFGSLCRYFSLYLSLISTVLWIVKEKKETHILSNSTIESVFQLVFIVAMAFTYTYFRASKIKIYRVMSRMWYSYNEDIQNIILKIASNGYYIATIQGVLVCVTCALYASSPLILPLFFSLTSSGNKTFEITLPLHEEFLVDQDKYLYIILAFQIIGLVDFGLLTSALNFLFCSFLVGIIGGIFGLKHSLKKMDAEYGEKILMSNENADKWIFLQLKDFIQYHQSLIDFYEYGRELFSPIMFIVLIGTTSGFILTTTSLVVLMDTDSAGAARMIAVPFMTMMVIIFACAPSQILKNASEDFFSTCCKLNYQNYPPKIRMMFLLIIMRAQTCFALTAGPRVELNFETCSTIIKSAFSYAAAFRSVYTSE